jgi:hypothetical protein
MKNTTMRTIGVISLVLFIVTVGFAAAQAAQPLDSSLIPTVVTDRPLTTIDSTASLNATETIPPEPVATRKTPPASAGGQAAPSSNSNSPAQQSGSSASAGQSADSDREVVKRSVRDDEDDEHDSDDEKKSEDEKKSDDEKKSED